MATIQWRPEVNALTTPQSYWIRFVPRDVVDSEELAKRITREFDCTPKGIIQRFDLKRPIYRKTAAYGHFGRPEFTWEKTDMADMLKEKAGL